jgi:hypothetical protein
MAAADPTHNADYERVVAFHHVPVREYSGIRLSPGERVMSVEWDSETDWFHVLIMSEHSDGPEDGA